MSNLSEFAYVLHGAYEWDFVRGVVINLKTGEEYPMDVDDEDDDEPET